MTAGGCGIEEDSLAPCVSMMKHPAEAGSWAAQTHQWRKETKSAESSTEVRQPDHRHWEHFLIPLPFNV